MLPTIDGNLFHENPVKSFQEGRRVKVPTMVGTTQDEGSFIAASAYINSEDELRQALAGPYPAALSLQSRSLSIFYECGY